MITRKPVPTMQSLLKRTQVHHLPRHMPKSPPLAILTRLASTRRPLDPISLHRLEAERRAYYNRRSYYAFGGALLSMFATFLLIRFSGVEPLHNDAPPGDSLGKLERGTPVVRGVTGGSEVRKVGEGVAGSSPGEKNKEEEEEVVPTGTSSVPTFPKNVVLAAQIPAAPAAPAATAGGKQTEYQLLGLGIRTVSFLSIQVYVVGLYIATQDISLLQRALIDSISPIATTLVPSEKERLKALLLDPGTAGQEVWSRVLRESGARTLLRIVPTRNTDFAHLRDGWVRGILARAQVDKYVDDAFGTAIAEFKKIFKGGSVAKGKTLLLSRGKEGGLSVFLDEGKEVGGKVVTLGGVEDERISRAVWMGYLAGKTVASEGARQSVVEGVMGFVERPVGTVETRVV